MGGEEGREGMGRGGEAGMIDECQMNVTERSV